MPYPAKLRLFSPSLPLARQVFPKAALCLCAEVKERVMIELPKTSAGWAVLSDPNLYIKMQAKDHNIKQVAKNSN